MANMRANDPVLSECSMSRAAVRLFVELIDQTPFKEHCQIFCFVASSRSKAENTSCGLDTNITTCGMAAEFTRPNWTERTPIAIS